MIAWTPELWLLAVAVATVPQAALALRAVLDSRRDRGERPRRGLDKYLDLET